MIEQDELIAALSIGGVDYIVIGGLAVAAHGYIRATKDLDIVPDPAAANLERLAAVLRDLDAVHYGTGTSTPRSSPSIP